MKGFQDLLEILKDQRQYIGVGVIKNLHIASDRSYLKVTLCVFPEERNVIAMMTWDNTGTDSGDFEFPSINDLVLFAQAEGDADQVYIIRSLTSREDTIPLSALNGDKVAKAKSGKKYYNISDTKILLGRTDADPAQNLILGQIFKSAYSSHLAQISDALQGVLDFLDAYKTHTHGVIGTGIPGTPVPTIDAENSVGNTDVSSIETAIDGVKSALSAIKASPVDDSAMLSDLTFTEK